MQEKRTPDALKSASGAIRGGRDRDSLSVFNRNPDLMKCQANCELCGKSVFGAEVLICVYGVNACESCFNDWVCNQSAADIAEMMGFDVTPAYDFEPLGDYGQDEEGWML